MARQATRRAAPIGSINPSISNALVEKVLELEQREIERREQAETISHEQAELGDSRNAKAVLKMNQEFPGAKIKLVNRNDFQTLADLTDPIGTRLTGIGGTMLDDYNQDIANLTVPALYDPNTKTIYIFKDRLVGGVINVKRLILHEMTHKGLDVMFNFHRDAKSKAEFAALMEDIYQRTPSKHKALRASLALQYGADVSTTEGRALIAEELVANLAERGEMDGIVARVIEFFRKFLMRIGVITQEDTWTNEDIRALIAEAHGALKGKERIAGVTLKEEVVLDETGEVFTIERNVQQELLQVKKRKEACERLRVCLG